MDNLTERQCQLIYDSLTHYLNITYGNIKHYENEPRYKNRDDIIKFLKKQYDEILNLQCDIIEIKKGL